MHLYRNVMCRLSCGWRFVKKSNKNKLWVSEYSMWNITCSSLNVLCENSFYTLATIGFWNNLKLKDFFLNTSQLSIKTVSPHKICSHYFSRCVFCCMIFLCMCPWANNCVGHLICVSSYSPTTFQIWCLDFFTCLICRSPAGQRIPLSRSAIVDTESAVVTSWVSSKKLWGKSRTFYFTTLISQL